MRLVRPLLTSTFLLLLVLPALQMRFRFVPEVELSGVLVESARPSLSLGAWWRGELQAQAETWFDDRIGFRGHAVRTDNQIGLSVFREASSKAEDSVVLGRRRMVYADAYVTAYDGIDKFRDRGLRRRARELRQLQDRLALRGIAFVFLISPSKAAIYPEYLPPGFVRADGERPKTAYERMLPMLRREGVHVVDGHALFQEEKARSPYLLFPPGGVHWNRYSAALVLRRVWQELGQQLGRPLVDLRWRAIREDDQPDYQDQETDGSDLLNAWHVDSGGWKFPRPDFFLDEGGGAALRPKLVAIGDSFWWVPDALIGELGMASRYEFFYYFNERTPPGGNPRGIARSPGLHRGMSWDYVFSADAIIVETNEAAIGEAGWGFVAKAHKQLLAAEAKPTLP